MVMEYERYSSKMVQKERRAAITLKNAPTEVQTYLRLTVPDTTYYSELRERLMSFANAGKQWHAAVTSAANDMPAPMEVGEGRKGKGESSLFSPL